MSSWFRRFQRATPPSSVGALILSTRRAKQWTILMFIMSFLMSVALYGQLIYPAFLPNDISNPAVMKFMASKDFQKISNEFFYRLEKFNRGEPWENDKRPPDFFASDPTQIGLAVNLYYRLVPRESDFSVDKKIPIQSQRQGYKYAPEITVKPYLPALIIFLLIESACLVGFCFLVFQKKPAAQVEFEERALNNFFLDEPRPALSADRSALQVIGIENALKKFHAFSVQLNSRYGNRKGIPIVDEYDVQDIMRALLKLHIEDVRSEECTPSYAGGASRMDFLLRKEEIVIEVKMARKNLRDAEIGAELLIDIARYTEHPHCKRLICFVYDPGNHVQNPSGLRSDIMRKGGELPVDVIFSPNN